MTHPIVLLCDAGPHIGSGHVMRMLTLAASLRARGKDVALLSGELPESLSRRAREIGASVVARQSGLADPALIDEVRSLDPVALVVDSYEVTSSTISRLAARHAIVLIDDNGEHADATADVVLNQNIHAETVDYGHGLTDARRLLGPKWALIREEVRALRDRVNRSDTTGVLVAIGGTDPLGLGAPIARAIEARRGIPTLHAHGLANADPFTPDRMARALATAEISVLACGTTTWEAAAVGLPFVGVVTADNQALIGESLERYDLATVIDARSTPPHIAVDLIVDAAAMLLDDEELRRRRSERLQSLVDGSGADRVADAIIELTAHPTR